MHARLHRRALGAVPLRAGRRAVVAVDAAAVPRTPGVRARDDLEQLARVDVADLDEVPAEQQEPRRVERDRLGDRLPLDRLVPARGLAVFLDVEAERWEEGGRQAAQVSEGDSSDEGRGGQIPDSLL